MLGKPTIDTCLLRSNCEKTSYKLLKQNTTYWTIEVLQKNSKDSSHILPIKHVFIVNALSCYDTNLFH